MLLYVVIAIGVLIIFELHGIAGRLEKIQSEVKDLEEQLKWYKDSSFAHQIGEWFQESSRGITMQIGEAFQIIQEIHQAASEIRMSLSNIEYNTSQDD